MPEKIFEYIDTPEKLIRALPLLEEAPAEDGIAVDTESDSLYSYQERVCLLQLSTRACDLIIDPIRLVDLSSVWPILEKKTLLFHGADYDISCLKRDYQLRPTKIFDSMIASWLLGYTQISLANLAEAKLGVFLTKEHQQDDWGQRPLPLSMIQYARDDTAYLHSLRDLLVVELKARDFEEAAEEEFLSVMNRAPRVQGFDPETYRQIKGVRELAPERRAILRALHIWRDGVAKEKNVPPFRVLRNATLLILAQRRPTTTEALRRLLSEAENRQYSAAILKTIQSAPPLPEAPPKERRKPPEGLISAEGRALLLALRKWRDDTAQKLDTDGSVVATSAFLEDLLIHRPKDLTAMAQLPNARAWRVKRFGAALLECLWGSPDGNTI